ncbi:MAG: DUF4835 family protein [Candidatus Neomarinimicrobiota bacterium]|nr:DUF4835 family protein [Candidatus Neomarinimicrobiota bacterium]|tara:strand:- start:3936 stop:4787 length:852 start_codon:yes stop_codon:yes gene_type:complete
MVVKKFNIHNLLLFVSIISIGFSQFLEANVEIDMRRLSESERQLLYTLDKDLSEYFINNQFSSDASDFEMIIDFRLVLESISTSGSQTTINAQAILTNKLDQNFYAKGIQFPYNKGQKIIQDSIFDPLAIFLDYYAFMFLAAELDTWEYMGGTSYYSKAIEKADIGKDSNFSRGWEDRWKKARKIKNNQYLRTMRFNYFLAQDELIKEKINYELVYESMLIFYENLKSIDEKLGSNKETLKFLNAYHLSIAELLSVLEINNGLKLLMHYDDEHKKIYESYLIN